ncbi:MAG: class II fructose-bisphosphate aldolase [Oceanospirillaceae bacterium]|nr:class II fructose-bisphosphate aldolase [Oceanospirillaceae bacterium]
MKHKFIEVLQDSFVRKRALLAFNVQNIYHLQILNEVTDELKLPVIAQFSVRFARHLESRYGYDLLRRTFRNDYIYFHLDHCQDLDFIRSCIDHGFDGVMYDGSAESLDLNIQNTKLIINHAQRNNCVVEAELGEIGGVEDGVGSERMVYASLNEVGNFVDETKVPLLALGIGNAHGFYTTLKNIDTSILHKAQSLLGGTQWFVLHGGSGLSDNLVKDTIAAGVVKINYSTQLKQLTNDAIAKYLERGELFNEINFEKNLRNEISPFFKGLIIKYTE